MGVRIARKHIAWYFKQIDQSLLPLVKESFSIQEPQLQLDFMNKIFHTLSKKNNTQHEF